jgi:hypothetical protein
MEQLDTGACARFEESLTLIFSNVPTAKLRDAAAECSRRFAAEGSRDEIEVVRKWLRAQVDEGTWGAVPIGNLAAVAQYTQLVNVVNGALSALPPA